MRRCSWLAAALALLPAAALAAPRVLVDADFGAGGSKVSDVDAAKGNRITGSLPEGWGDNSGWKEKVVAEYSQMAEGGRRFTRVRQTSGDGLQFVHALAGLDQGEGYYRLTLSARSVVGASLAIRFMGPPYSSPWTAGPAMDASWRTYSYDFRLPAQSEPLGLFIYLSGNGTLDIEKLKLVRLSDQDLIDEIKAKYPDAGKGNLVKLSRFPLGLQSGWSIDRDYSDGDQVRVDTGPRVLGPSGVPALKIDAPEGVLVYSAPFAVPWSFETHTASLSVRGEWQGRLLVCSGEGGYCGEIPLKLSGAEWQRVAFPFKPILLARAHHLRIEGKGMLWFDGLQVEHGAAASPFAPQKPVEVSLAQAPSSASSARVVFDDEPLAFRYAVVGGKAGAVLKARLVTMYGDAKALPPVKLTAGLVRSGTLHAAAVARHPLGPYRLEAWVEDAAGKKLSAENEVVFERLHRPRYWAKDAPNSFFGTHTLSTNRHLTMAKAFGCNWVRLHDAGTAYIGWSFLEPEKGKWQFHDTELRRYREHHLKILGLLSTSPGWASNWGKPCTGYFERYLEPLRMEDWANAVRAIVSHHRGLIDSYEIWNEPWGASFWSWRYDEKQGSDYLSHFVRSETAPADYARLQKVAYAAAHEADPGVTIVGFNTFVGDTGSKWTRDVLDGGGLEACDAISYHHYETSLLGMPGDAAEKGYRSAMGPIIEKVGRVPKPVWMSEGAPLSGDVSNGFYRCTLPYENTNDNWRLADRLARYVISRRANGEKHAFLYTMHGFSTFGGSVEWTSLVAADGYPHPTSAAHSALAWLTEDLGFAKRITLSDGVHACLFSGQRGAVAAITTAASHAAYKLPSAPGVQVLDLFGNPVAPGTALDSHVHYAVCPAGLSELEAALRGR